MKKIIILVAFLFIIIFTLFYVDFEAIVNVPKRPNSVPKTAIWSGGNDGGYWFEYKNYNKETNEFNIVIYNDISGKILIKSNFVLKNDCKSIFPHNDKLLKEINYYANGEIVLINGCVLVATPDAADF